MSSSAERLLTTAAGGLADATPVWFMRQAGRCLPQYRELRQRFSLLEMVRNPELCAQITCMPVDQLGVDGAVLFADIMLPLEGMGVEFEIREGVGPVVANPIRSRAQVEALRVVPAEEATPYLFEAIRSVRRELGDRAGLLGFGPAPFTLACYLVEGQGARDYPHVRSLMHSDPGLWELLMERLTQVLGDYLVAQAAAGVQIVQLFDSWIGTLDELTFRKQVAPSLTRLLARLKGRAPAIYFSTSSTHLLRAIAETGPDGVSVDWRLPLDQAWATIGGERVIQGNLDPAVVLAPWEVAESAAREVLARAGGRPGHIFNLGHGVLPDSSPDQLRRLVDLVHRESAREGR